MAHMSLYELNSLIKSELQNSMAPSYWVIAEISELRENVKGHCYMELVEKERNFIQAKIRANIWAYTYRTIKQQFNQATGSPLKAGIKVLFNVSINFHEVYGMSLTVNNIDPNFTIGEKTKQREETIKKLREEGYLELNKALPLPLVPQRLAIISSSTAAGYGDFMDQLSNNAQQHDFKTETFNAVMQGNETEESIGKALANIKERSSEFDLIVIIRGGGAQTDLDSFDAYGLAKLIAAAPLPVLTGIGHERDETIADLVSNTSLKTPTAVAEFIINGMDRFYNSIYELNIRLERGIRDKFSRAKDQLAHQGHRLERAGSTYIKQADNLLRDKAHMLKFASKAKVEKQKNSLDNLQNKIKLIDPENVFKRGYSITLKNGRSINNQEVMVGDNLVTKNHQSTIKSKVTDIENE
ncbi:MAG: exodeoxyribonuclease VII large subunit [Roseivirga sp. XM-24bin3]|nr:MAG: exodeoxyribonuclease VII large subunit [Roseivirga sp. XM-24bin3]